MDVEVEPNLLLNGLNDLNDWNDLNHFFTLNLEGRVKRALR
jgi:hypothetical protein